MSIVIELKKYQAEHCVEVPTSERCTNRLHEGICPGRKEGRCASPNLDETKHNAELPKFFMSQH